MDYLIIAAHPDDAEIGVGGTIAALKAEGATVGILDLTSGEPTPLRHARDPPARDRGGQCHSRRGLARQSRFAESGSCVADLEARRQLAGMIRQLEASFLLTHYWEDAHPDHVAASALVDAARFWSKLTKTDLPGEPHYPARIFYFLSIHLRLHVKPSFVVDVSAHHATKMRAVECYHSQFIQGRPTTPPTLLDDLRDWARYWGWTIGTTFGEPFLCREEVGMRSLRDLA